MKSALNLLLTLSITLFAFSAYGQKTSGTITGTVADTSGAVISGATVSVTSASTGISRTATTDARGVYTVPDLEPGTYRVNVQAAKFKESIFNNVVLHVASIQTVNVTMEVGGASQVVEVTGSEVQVQTDSASLGSVVDSTQVSELPLNGRSFVQLTQLVPGVAGANNFDSKNKGLQGGVDFSVNGNATTNNLFLVDGANNNDVGSNRTILVYPSIEAIGEFKILQNSYGPEYGQASGGVINIVTKSGTNTFHGSAFYSGRNSAVAAWDYFAKVPGAKKPPLRRNDYGFSIGGPVLKNKLFFFYSEEWNKELRGIVRSSCVPTAAERNGDFTTTSCSATPPTIPAAFTAGNPRIIANPDPTGKLLISKYPLPNIPLTNGNNWSTSEGSKLDWREENVRVDYNLTKSNTLMGRYTQDHWENPAPNGNVYWGDDNFPLLQSNWAQPSKMAIGRLTSTLGASIVNNAEFAYSNNRINITAGGSNPELLPAISNAVPPLFPATLKTAPEGIPTINSGFGNYGNSQTFQLIAPWTNSLDIYTARDDLSMVRGNHTWKAGVFLGWNGKNEDNGPASSERPTFSLADSNVAPGGFATGNQLANALIPGNIFKMTENSTNVVNHLRWRDYEFYVGDTWKVTKRFTAELGVRYSLLFTPFQPDNLMTSFVPALYDPAKPKSDACNGLWIISGKDPCGDANKEFGTTFSSGTPGPNHYLVHQNHHLFAPRIGFAWDPWGDGNTAIRVGVGQFFQRERVSGPYYIMSANAPFSLSTTFNRAIGAATPPPSVLAGNAAPVGGHDPSATNPNSWQWNFTIQHSFAKDTTLQVGYVGNRAIHQTSSYDINTVDPTHWTTAAFLTGGALNAIRPFSNFGQLAWWSHQGDANYHSFQTEFKARYKRSQFTAAYTWSHAISTVELDNSSGGLNQASFLFFGDPSLDRGNSTTNRPHIFVANANFFLPNMTGANTFVRGVLGGWELGVIQTASSGASHTVFQNGISENTSLVVPGAPGAGSLNATIGTGQTSMLRPLLTGQDCTAGRHQSQLYNPNAFTLVGYVIGTIPSNIEPRGFCPGPRLINTDLSINKNFSLTERVKMQLRFDLFDLFNHPNFRGDQLQQNNVAQNVNCGTPVGGFYQPCSPANNVITRQTPQSQFGISNLTVGNAGRQLQYGLRFSF
jgi:hypothetical protein